MVQYFMTNIYQSEKERNKDDGSGVFYKHKVSNIYNSKYQLTYSNQYYVIKTTIRKIQEYVGHIKEEKERQQVMFI